MSIAGQVIINLFAASILFTILINEIRRQPSPMPQDRLFMRMVYPNMILCLSDAIAWSMENQQGTLNFIINHIFTSTAFLCIPILTCGWFLYAYYEIFKDENKLARIQRILWYGILIFSLFVFTNPLTHWVYYLDANNCYHRGLLFYPYTMIFYVFMVATLGMILGNRKRIARDHFMPLLFFVLPTVITSILAILFYGIALAWVGTTLAIFIIYLFIQSQRLGTDYLTGLYNRRELDEYLNNRIEGRRADESFGIAMFDIDQFKYINDTWGHKAGDEALVTLSAIMRSVFRSREFLVRFAGDEFVVIFDVHGKEEMTAALRRLVKAIDHFNEKREKTWKLSVSIGYDLYSPDSGMNGDALLNHVDKLMYQAKNMQKSLGGQSSGCVCVMP